MVKLISKEEPNIVYSSDGSHLKKKKGKKITDPIPSESIIKVRREVNSRGGKTVTVLFELPVAEMKYYQKMTKKLKNLCGSGGTYKNDQIEIQGDHRDKVYEYLKGLGFQAKLAGG